MPPARILKIREAAPGLFELCLELGSAAADLEPGHSLLVEHATGGPSCLPVRDASGVTGWADLLFSGHESANRWLTRLSAGDELRVKGVEGRPVQLSPAVRRLVTVGKGPLSAHLIFLLARCRHRSVDAVGLFQWDHGLPFRPVPSRIMIPGLPPHVIAADPQLESWSIPSRIASELSLPGCHEGPAGELLSDWLAERRREDLSDALVVVAGPDDFRRDILARGKKGGIACVEVGAC